jgi:hypothetical protein
MSPYICDYCFKETKDIRPATLMIWILQWSENDIECIKGFFDTESMNAYIKKHGIEITTAPSPYYATNDLKTNTISLCLDKSMYCKGYKKQTKRIIDFVLQEFICLEMERSGVWSRKMCGNCPVKKIMYKL